MIFAKPFQKCLAQASNILRKGDFSDSAIERACEKIAKFADQMERQLSKYKWFEPYKQDNTPMSMFAETGGDAVGENTSSTSTVKAGLYDYKNVTIGIGVASTVAAADGGAEVASTSAFTGVSGANFAMTKSYNVTGENFQASTEAIFAVDFKFLNDAFNLSVSRDVAMYTDARAAVGGGNVAQVEMDVVAKATNTSVDVFADALAVEDTISSTYAGVDLIVC